MYRSRTLWTVFAAILLISCTGSESAEEAATSASASCQSPEIRDLVASFGARLNQVSLLAPDSAVRAAVRQAYSAIVTPELLAKWDANPTRAPGREVSSPWPDRIEIRSIEAVDGCACRVMGDVVYVTSVEAASGNAAFRAPVALRLVEQDGWRISEYELGLPATSDVDPTASPAPAPPATSTEAPTDPVDVIRSYYAAISSGDYRRAYELWGSGGSASGQTYEEFAEGFAETANVEVEVGQPGRVEGAAGSQYVEVPVTIRAETTTGETQRFQGSYTLRRSMVEGASPAQAAWHIYSADVRAISDAE